MGTEPPDMHRAEGKVGSGTDPPISQLRSGAPAMPTNGFRRKTHKLSGKLDFVVDPGSGSIIGNPAYGGQYMIEMY